MNQISKTILFSVILMTIGAFFILSCTSNRKITAQNYRHYKSPPNGYKVDTNLFYDKTEMSNFNWLEYVYWTEKVYGLNSKEYFAVMPDTSVWERMDSCNRVLSLYYLRHPAYRDYPVVGISQKQANDYSKWRSDRVLEHILISTGVIKADTSRNSNSFFTIEKYYTGKYKGIKPDFSIPYPSYKLPNKQERIKALNYTDSIRQSAKPAKKPTELYSEKYGTVISYQKTESDSCKHQNQTPKPNWFQYCKRTNEVISHIRGNVCEWSEVPSVCYGGSWEMPMDSNVSKDTFIVSDTANLSTGFRNVCTWEYWDLNKK